VLPFFEAKVLGDELGTKVKRTGKSYYQYSNGSMLFWGGMWDERQREAIRSVGQDAGLDFALLDEATQFDERDFEEISGRMRGKAAPYTQIILGTNPDAPTHWINQRLIIGGIASVYYSGYQDNPHNPDSYGFNLELMTGVLHDRLVKGLWVIAEGAVYENFDPRYNVTIEAEYNPDWDVRWGVDDGYVFGDGPGHANYHPRVILFGQQTPQGGLNIFNEYVKAQELQEVSIANVLQWNYELPELAAVDSSASQLRARIGDAGIMHSGATHEVAEGIKVVRRYICDGQGVRLLKIHPRCVHTIREFQSLRYDLKSKTVKAGQPKPLKVDDHCPDAARYMIWSIK
jgi:PBSX family phage terminase large subunit